MRPEDTKEGIMGAEVVVIGAAGLDTCVYLPPGADLSSDVTFTSTLDGVGQAGGYASLVYASLGHVTAYFGAIGDDAAGREVRDVLDAHGIDLDACFPDPEGTARSVNLMTPDGRRRACYDGRGNPGVAVDRTRAAAVVRGARLCHVNIPNWARDVLPIARDAGCRIVTDLQDVADPADAYRSDFVEGSDLIAFSCARDIEPVAMMHAYWARNPRLVQLAGMGADGCAVGIDGVVVHHPAPAASLPIVDTNGAGDTLTAVFAAGLLLEGRAPTDAAHRAQLAARVTCSQRVPKLRFPTRRDLDDGDHAAR